MNIKEWIKEKHIMFNTMINSEEDLKIKVLLPYLKYLGYETDELSFENGIDVQVGTKKTKVYSDLEIKIDGNVEIIIDTKNPKYPLSEKDILQVVSYAKLNDTPHALYGIVTNGTETITVDAYTGVKTKEIPTRKQLLRDITKSKKTQLQDIELREVQSILFTLYNTDQLYKVINDCKEVIEKRGLIRSDQSFREMTKIILIKMNEERRVKAKEGQNRFSSEYMKMMALVNNTTELEVFKNLFDEAKEKYPSIYTNENEQLSITDELCIKHLIMNLEPFSFLGTGDDIKGAVYEIFLKATLRGEFDQYFTPRELVDFMVNFADPNIGDVIVDPACGSGGFLIQAFNYVNSKINESGSSEIDNNNKFRALVDKCLWGHEADYDLHVLAKINLIMHGDGWNNIYQGDTLKSDKLPENNFDLVLANPPFTIKYAFADVLEKFDLGMGKNSEELDILFVEKSIKLLKTGRDLFIILPEGLLNNKKYDYFRTWLLQNTDMLLSVSLPEGAFIPFGGSVSKTCILGVRKKGALTDGYVSPKYVFLGHANEVGYETGKKGYRKKKNNDLAEFKYLISKVFDGVKTTSNNGECGWIKQSDIDKNRLDANYLLNKIDRKKLLEKYEKVVPLKEIVKINDESVSPSDEKYYYYLEVPDISGETGCITNIRYLKGDSIGDSFHVFNEGDILFTRINPRISRVAIVPNIDAKGIVSKEVYNLQYIQNKYIKYESRYVICVLLQNELVKKQIIRLSTGSSSSRARVQKDDFLNDVYVPILTEKVQKEISESAFNAANDIWSISQKYLKTFSNNQKAIGSEVAVNEIRKI